MSRANKALTCDMDRMHNITIFVFITLTTVAAACGPCDDTIIAAPGANFDHVCIPDDDGGAEVGESGVGGEGEETGADPTGGDTCDAAGVPEETELGGPCGGNSVCDDGLICQVWPSGSLCTTPCPIGDVVCSDIMCGAGDACVPGAACMADCQKDDDCPHDGMVCDTVNISGQCLWPSEALCSIPPGVWGPCDDGACDDGFCVQHDGVGSLCAPACVDGECPISCNGECRADGACAPPCAADSDCPIDGMVCDAAMPGGAACLWPSG